MIITLEPNAKPMVLSLVLSEVIKCVFFFVLLHVCVHSKFQML